MSITGSNFKKFKTAKDAHKYVDWETGIKTYKVKKHKGHFVVFVKTSDGKYNNILRTDGDIY